MARRTRNRYRPDRRRITPEQLGYEPLDEATAARSARNTRFRGVTTSQLQALLADTRIGEAARERIRAELEHRLGPKRAQKRVARATAAGVTEADIRMDCRRWCKERGAELIVDTEQNRPTRVTEGVSDLIVFWPDGGGVWYVEVKRHPNVQTAAQGRFQRAVEAAGEVYILAYSTEDLEERWDTRTST